MHDVWWTFGIAGAGLLAASFLTLKGLGKEARGAVLLNLVAMAMSVVGLSSFSTQAFQSGVSKETLAGLAAQVSERLKGVDASDDAWREVLAAAQDSNWQAADRALDKVDEANTNAAPNYGELVRLRDSLRSASDGSAMYTDEELARAMAQLSFNAVATLAPTLAPASVDPLTRERLKLAAKAKEQLDRMSVLLGWAEELKWDQQSTVTVVVAAQDVKVARAALMAQAGQKIDETTAEIGKRIRADLTGADVEIAPDFVQEADVTPLGNVSLTWRVKPTRPGTAHLTARIWNGIEMEPDKYVWIERPAYQRTVKVKIGLLDYLTWQMGQMAGLQWVLGGFGASLAAIFMNRAVLRRWWRARKAKRAVQPPAPPAPPVPPDASAPPQARP